MEKRTQDVPAAFVLLKILEKSDFIKTFDKINSMEKVTFCCTVKGDIDLFLYIEGDGCAGYFEKEIKTLAEVKEARFCPIEVPLAPESKNNLLNALNKKTDKIPSKGAVPDQTVFSFILIESESGKVNSLASSLKNYDEIVYCSLMCGNNIIMIVKGMQFVQIDKFISNKLMNLDGILKIKEYPIISIYEL